MNPIKFTLLAFSAAALGGLGAHIFLPPAAPVEPSASLPRPASPIPIASTSAAPSPHSVAGTPVAPEIPVATAPAAGTERSNTPLPPPAPSNAEKIAMLRDILVRLPEQGIPELKLLTEGDWHLAVDAGLDTPEDVRRALASLRTAGERRFIRALQPALKEYIRANGGAFPTDPMQLQSLASREIEPAMLQRYGVVPASTVPNLGMEGDSIITQAIVIDSEYHVTQVLGKNSTGSTSTPPAQLQALSAVSPLQKAYRAAHGSEPRDFQLLLPYATTPEQYAAIQTLKKAQEKAQEKTKTR